MTHLKKPEVSGPAPSRKAGRALGEKLNRKSKTPPDPKILDRHPPKSGSSGKA